MKILQRRFKRVLAFVSDLHAGSEAAPWPNHFMTSKGRVIDPTAAQLRLNQYLTDFMDHWDEFKVDSVWLMGDLVQGTNRREFGSTLMTSELNEQIRAAVELLEPGCRNRPVYGVSGSKYHDSLDTKLDAVIVKELGGEYLGMLANVPIRGTGRTMRLMHGASGAAIYREMVMGRDSLFTDAAEGRGKIPFHVDITVTGHLHFFTHIHSEGRHMLQLPCWCDWIPWKGSMKYYAKMLPDIGGCLLLIDEDDRISIMHFLYDRPEALDGLVDEK